MPETVSAFKFSLVEFDYYHCVHQLLHLLPLSFFLPRYCDCFAAGIYCAESCACQGCFNRPEYEDTVIETRQQIESRNPNAFAPKIVQHVAEFAAVSAVINPVFFLY